MPCQKVPFLNQAPLTSEIKSELEELRRRSSIYECALQHAENLLYQKEKQQHQRAKDDRWTLVMWSTRARCFQFFDLHDFYSVRKVILPPITQ